MFRRLVPALVAVALTACGGGEETTTATAPPSPATTPATAPTDDAAAPAVADVAVPAALDFSAPLLGGGEIELGALAGRPVLLWFWAPW